MLSIQEMFDFVHFIIPYDYISIFAFIHQSREMIT